jgi:hypothetical protein
MPCSKELASSVAIFAFNSASTILSLTLAYSHSNPICDSTISYKGLKATQHAFHFKYLIHIIPDFIYMVGLPRCPAHSSQHLLVGKRWLIFSPNIFSTSPSSTRNTSQASDLSNMSAKASRFDQPAPINDTPTALAQTISPVLPFTPEPSSDPIATCQVRSIYQASLALLLHYS